MGWRPADARPLPDGREPGARIRASRHWATRPDAAPLYRGLWRCARRHVLLGCEPRVADPALLPAQGRGREACRLRRCRLAVELCWSDDFPGHRRSHLMIALLDAAVFVRQ